MKTGIVSVILFFMIFTLHAQQEDEKNNLKNAMLDYIEGFYEGDTLKINRSISPEAVKYGYWKDKNTGQYTGEPMSFQQMIDYAVGVKKRNKPASSTAVKKVELFEVQDQTASGKVTAWWGTDYLLLEKIGSKWMIRMILWQGPLKA